MKARTAVVTAAVMFFAAGAVQEAGAEQWQLVGPRALAMGGAHVAAVNDGTASYWNPARFGFFGAKEEKEEGDDDSKVWGFHIHGGVGAQLQGGVAQEVNDVLDYDFDDLADKAENGTIVLADLDDFTLMVAEVRDLNKEKIGLNALANAGLNIRVKNFGIGAYALTELGADPTIDLTNLGIDGGVTSDAIDNIADLGPSGSITPAVLTAAQYTGLIATVDAMPGWSTADAEKAVNALDGALDGGGVTSVSSKEIEAFEDIAQIASDLEAGSGGGTLDDNNTNVLFKGAGVLEVPITYGHAFNEYFALGGNLKFMEAVVYYNRISVFDKDEDDFFEDAFDDYTRSSNWGVDLGGMADFGFLRLGVVGRNLNSPKFDYDGPGDYQLDTQVRAGAAFVPVSWFTLAVDVDVLENKTPFANYRSQTVGGGVELKLLDFLSLRGGAYNNFAESGAEPVYTAGLGLDIWGLNLDAAVAVSGDSTTIDGDSIPAEARAEVAFSLQY